MNFKLGSILLFLHEKVSLNSYQSVHGPSQHFCSWVVTCQSNEAGLWEPTVVSREAHWERSPRKIWDFPVFAGHGGHYRIRNSSAFWWLQNINSYEVIVSWTNFNSGISHSRHNILGAMGTIINHIWHWKSILSVEGSSIKLLRSISIFSILS